LLLLACHIASLNLAKIIDSCTASTIKASSFYAINESIGAVVIASHNKKYLEELYIFDIEKFVNFLNSVVA
jgi:hypothetical protein